MYLGGELFDIDAIESDSDEKYSSVFLFNITYSNIIGFLLNFRSGSEDDAEFEKYLSKTSNTLNKSIQGEIVKRNKENKLKQKDTFEDEMEEHLDSIILSLQEKYSFNRNNYLTYIFAYGKNIIFFSSVSSFFTEKYNK